MVENLRDAGITSVAAAGNYSRSDAMAAPACLSNVIAVGNVLDNLGVNSSSNSSEGLDVWAPGTSVRGPYLNNGVAAYTGTSQAAPQVAAAVALLRQADAHESVSALQSCIETSPTYITDPDNGITRPLLNLPSAVDACAGPTSNSCESTRLGAVAANASSQEGAHVAYNAIDGNPATRWSSAFSDPQWLSVDLGARRRVDRVILRWETAASADYRVEIADSANGPWTLLAGEENAAIVGSGNSRVDTLSSLSGSGRHLRIFSIVRSRGWGNSLFEVEILGDTDPNCGSDEGPACGNGLLESGEQCDDGNLANGDGCSSACQNEPPPAACGNRLLEAGEQCDDGNLANGDGCSSACATESTPPSGACFLIQSQRGSAWLVAQAGKIVASTSATQANATVFERLELGAGQVKWREDGGTYLSVESNQLSLGQTESGASVFLEVACGANNRYGYASTFGGAPHWKNVTQNGAIQSGEAGNPGQCNPADAASWEAFYLVPTDCGSDPVSYCGDGVLDASEQCDDGNAQDGDGCDDACNVETSDGCGQVALSRVAATASSSENASLGASFAIDGNAGTRWASSFEDPSWITVDLGTSRHINAVVLRWEAAASRNYDIRISSDGTNWMTLYNDPNGDGGVDTVTDLGAVGRYVQMYSHLRATAWGNSLFEFEIHGDPNPNCQ
jgi:cysteine-rich repeat protein